MKVRNKIMLAAATVSLTCGVAWAEVSADEAALLNGASLTAWGAERAGNKDGSIPTWTGEAMKVPADYDPKDMRLPGPFKGDKPLFTITAQNMDKYADKLTAGYIGMFKQYPGFRMDVYPTRRTATYPKYVLDNTVKNATACKAVENGLVLRGCYGGFPFPIPKTGNEAMWNHLARYEVQGLHILSDSILVDASGRPILQAVNDSHQVFASYYPESEKPLKNDALYWKLRFDQTDPPRVNGQKFVILDALDSVNIGRRVYSYVPGQRRVKLAPDLAYDTPSPVSGGAGTMDSSQLFLGAQDRYDIKLLGKKEKFIPYNNYELTDYKVCPTEKQTTKNFVNPDCMRWELHRVWELQLTLKPGFRHILPKRVIYFDEDTWGAGAEDSYDGAGKLYRVDFQPYVHVYAGPSIGNVSDCNQTHDLQTGIYFAACLMGRPGEGLQTETPKTDAFYSPEALAGEGVR